MQYLIFDFNIQYEAIQLNYITASVSQMNLILSSATFPEEKNTGILTYLIIYTKEPYHAKYRYHTWLASWFVNTNILRQLLKQLYKVSN